MPSHPLTLNIPSYAPHPLYSFRRPILISTIIGIILTIMCTSSAPAYANGPWLFGTFTLLASGLVAFADLLLWAHKKNEEDAARWQRHGQVCRVCAGRLDGENVIRNEASVTAATSSSSTLPNIFATRDDSDDDKPKWPVRWIMIFDFLLTGWLFWLFCYEIVIAEDSWYRYSWSSPLLNCYATVPVGFSCILHARCWWREFRAREREAWVRGLRLGIGMPRGIDDVEVGVGRVSHPYVCGHESGEGRHLDPGCEGHGNCGSSNGNQPSSVAQRRNDLADSVKGLNREAIQALTSKIWLRGRSNTGERQPLLTRNVFPHTEHTQYVSESSKSCACSHSHACRSVGPASRSATHAHVHGPIGRTDNDDVGKDLKDAQEVEPIAIDRTTAYLTPSNSDASSASSSTVSSSTRDQKNFATESKKDVNDGTDIEDEGTAANSVLLSHGGKVLRGDDNDDDDDMGIVVIKKAKKGKAKAQKQRKEKSREVDFEE